MTIMIYAIYFISFLLSSILVFVYGNYIAFSGFKIIILILIIVIVIIIIVVFTFIHVIHVYFETVFPSQHKSRSVVLSLI